MTLPLVQRGDALVFNGGEGFGVIVHVNAERNVALVVVESGRCAPLEVGLATAHALVRSTLMHPKIMPFSVEALLP